MRPFDDESLVLLPCLECGVSGDCAHKLPWQPGAGALNCRCDVVYGIDPATDAALGFVIPQDKPDTVIPQYRVGSQLPARTQQRSDDFTPSYGQSPIRQFLQSYHLVYAPNVVPDPTPDLAADAAATDDLIRQRIAGMYGLTVEEVWRPASNAPDLCLVCGASWHCDHHRPLEEIRAHETLQDLSADNTTLRTHITQIAPYRLSRCRSGHLDCTCTED